MAGQIYSFRNLVGNTALMRLMQSSLIDKSFPQFAIFSGVMGTGKSTCAGIAALTLLCEGLVEGEPCLQCDSCKQTLQALKTGEGIHVAKKNFGMIDKKVDVSELVQEVFKLSAEGTCVYIFEEFHAIPRNMQIIFLEEIDLLPPNIYIILCTTKYWGILPELASRAINFEFRKLADVESKALLEMYLRKKGINKPPSELFSAILRHSKGIPRDIINIVDFILSGNKSYDDIKEFMNLLTEDDFYDIFDSMFSDYGSFVIMLTTLLDNYSSQFIIQLKDFWLNFMFYPEVKVLSGERCKKLHSKIPREVKFQIARLLESMNSVKNETDIKFLFIRIYDMLSKRAGRVSSPAAQQERLHTHEIQQQNDSPDVELAKLGMDSVLSIK